MPVDGPTGKRGEDLKAANQSPTPNSSIEGAAPEVDVVVPTLNCAADLERCLSALTAQVFRGRLHVLVVDGGSTDRTVDVARNHGATVIVNPGQYLTGLNGARHFGEMKGNSPYVWNVDSDNFLVETTVAQDLVGALEADPALQVALPMTAVDRTANSFNNWLALDEIASVHRMMKHGHPRDSAVIVDELDYGLTNATVVRRSALEKALGYDSDVRQLFRLRRLGLARGAVVTSAHFVHNQVSSWWDYRRKWIRRILRVARMSEEELSRYFVEYPPTRTGHEEMAHFVLSRTAGYPYRAGSNFLRDQNVVWLWGLFYPVILLSILVTHPVAFRKVWRRFI